MANVISLQFNNQIALQHYKSDFVANSASAQDLFYALGTNFNTTSWSNPSVNLTLTNVNADIFDLTHTSTINTPLTGTPNTIRFNNHFVLLNKVVAYVSGNNAEFGVDFLNQDGAWISQGSIATGASPAYYTFDIDPTTNFYTDSIRFKRTATTNTGHIFEVKVYGILVRKDGDSIGTSSPMTTISQLPDNALSYGNQGLVRYSSSLYHDDANFIHRSAVNVVLTGDITIGDTLQNVFISIDPNGADRNVILSQAPLLNHQYRLVSTDGSNSINIRETVGGPILVTLSNAAGVLTADIIWDNVDTWHIVA